STDGGATWHPARGRETWSYTWQVPAGGTTTLRSRAVDDSGNLEVPNAGISVTLGSPQCPCAIWSSAAVPAVADAGPDSSVELGVRFLSDTAGYITGLRFYKGSGNTGTHVGNLWSASGALLASATFAGETASGWQQVNFSAPVAVTANTIYIVSYHTGVGHFSVNRNYFTSTGVDNSPLHAPASGVSGLNGVYAYATSSTFPASSWSDSNYWVDVVFHP
ncbi:MAG TPA: DUF4082 domain-containing protein, partial [Candidatus Acidoferrales bacterium]|nr:DUF4082 domain-containing protein [Candidatus Acidoferrales bacterium]